MEKVTPPGFPSRSDSIRNSGSGSDRDSSSDQDLHQDKEKHALSPVQALPTLTLKNDTYPLGGDLPTRTRDKDQHNNDDGRDEQGVLIKPDIPWRYRLLAFSMILFFATSSSFCESTLGPLKSTLVKELKITSESEYKSHFALWMRGSLGMFPDDRCPIWSYRLRFESGQYHPAHHWRYWNGLRES